MVETWMLLPCETCCRFVGSDWWLCCTLERPQHVGKLATCLHSPCLRWNVQMESAQLVSDLWTLGAFL